MTVLMFPSRVPRPARSVVEPRAASGADLPALLKLLGCAFADYHSASDQHAILLGSAAAPGTLDVAAADAAAFSNAMRLNGFLPCAEADIWRHPSYVGRKVARVGGGHRAEN